MSHTENRSRDFQYWQKVCTDQITQTEFRNAKFPYARCAAPWQPTPVSLLPGTPVVGQQLAPPPGFQLLDLPLYPDVKHKWAPLRGGGAPLATRVKR